MNLKDTRRRLNSIKARYEVARHTARSEKVGLQEAQARLAALQESQVTIQAAAQMVQQQAHAQMAGVVTRCLAAIFDEPYEFRITFEQRRGKTEAVLEFVRDNNPVDPLTASEGGQVDVAAFALRLACLLLERPARRRLLVLDEPFRFIDKTNRPRLRALLESLAVEFSVQMVLVTHDPGLQIGKVIEL